MKLIRQIFTSALIISLLIPGSFAYATPDSTDKTEKETSLSQLREQAKQDMAQFKQMYGKNTKDLLPAVMAFVPLFTINSVKPLHDINPIQELKSFLKAPDINALVSAPQKKFLTSFTEALQLKQYDEAWRIFSSIEPQTWKTLVETNKLDSQFTAYLRNLLLRESDRTTAHAAAEELAPASQFFVMENRPGLSVRATYVELNYAYNDMREILQFIEKNKRVLKEKEILAQIENKYSRKPWWRRASNLSHPSAMSDIFYTIIHKKDLLYKNPQKLLKYIEKLETIPMSLEARRALQTNLLARTNNLRFFIQESFMEKTIVLESKILKPNTRSLLLRNVRYFSLFFLVLGAATLASQTPAQAEDLDLLQSLHEDIDIFLKAEQDDLEYIQQYELSAEYCRQFAETLHETVSNPALVPIAQDLMNELRTEQTAPISKDIIKQLQTVRAY